MKSLNMKLGTDKQAQWALKTWYQSASAQTGMGKRETRQSQRSFICRSTGKYWLLTYLEGIIMALKDVHILIPEPINMSPHMAK